MLAEAKQVQTSAPSNKNIETLCENIKEQLRKGNSYHLTVAKMLNELHECYKGKETDFLEKVKTEFDLERRSTYQYLKVARTPYVHDLDLEFSKKYLLCIYSQEDLSTFLAAHPIKKLKAMTVKALESVMTESNSQSSKEEGGAVVTNLEINLIEEQEEMLSAEKEILRLIESAIEKSKELQFVTSAFKAKVKESINELKKHSVSKNFDYLTANTKFIKISGSKTESFGIPANQEIGGVQTCPQAGACATGCFATRGFYVQHHVQRAQLKRFELTKTDQFVSTISKEIKRKRLERVRIHDSGDFYSREYAMKWVDIANRNPNVTFYTYTKAVSLFKELIKNNLLPQNFIAVLSFNGKEDNLIDINTDRHSKVFESVEELQAEGYVDAHEDDSVAIRASSNKIGLVYHGVKHFIKTSIPRANEINSQRSRKLG